MNAMVAQQDISFRRLAHRLKGACGAVGANELVAAYMAAEYSEPHAMREASAALAETLARLVAYLA
ncbi:MAG: Hpt domain-containing protein [Kofleriaceae bacterium]|nr:Hpt domain-containing protein [Kofleriaceae bacterium]